MEKQELIKHALQMRASRGFESPNKYSTYEEAKNTAHKLKIKSRKEYHLQKRYLEDLGLTCNPDRKFKNKGWISWDDFLGY